MTRRGSLVELSANTSIDLKTGLILFVASVLIIVAISWGTGESRICLNSHEPRYYLQDNGGVRGCYRQSRYQNWYRFNVVAQDGLPTAVGRSLGFTIK